MRWPPRWRVCSAPKRPRLRYDADGAARPIAAHGPRHELPDVAALVWRSGRTVRVDRVGAVAAAIGAPIVVDGRPWGLAIVAWGSREAVAPGAEDRMAHFIELVATAVANADETRRRIERDLHDGTQQRLVTLALALRATEARVPAELDGLRAELSDAAQGFTAAVEDLQEYARGIHAAVLSKGGLAPALKTLARRSQIPVELRVDAVGPLETVSRRRRTTSSRRRWPTPPSTRRLRSSPSTSRPASRSST
jgi:signal transduction histidine kinase